MANSVEKPIEAAIREGLAGQLNPIHLEVVNESYMHNVPKGAETHFKVLVVSEQFDGLPLIKVTTGSYLMEQKMYEEFWNFSATD